MFSFQSRYVWANKLGRAGLSDLYEFCFNGMTQLH